MMKKKPTLRRSTRIGLSTMALSMLALSAQAQNLVTNGSFTNLPLNPASGFLMTPFATNEVQNWSTSSGASILVFPGAATTPVNGFSLWPGCGAGSTVLNCIPVPAAQQLPATSPDGGNFIAVDGAFLQGTLQQKLTNLQPGLSYNVSFYQGAAQLHDQNSACCTGATTEQWEVSLSDVLFGGTTTEIHLSALMQNASQSFVNWQAQSLTFTATNATEMLGFFAIGTPNGVPPVVLLDGVSVTAVPEPETLALIGIGLLSLLLTRRPQRT